MTIIKLLRPEAQREVGQLERLIVFALQEPKIDMSAFHLSEAVSIVKESPYKAIYDFSSLINKVISFRIANSPPFRTSPPNLISFNGSMLEQAVEAKLQEYQGAYSKRPPLKEIIDDKGIKKACYDLMADNIINDILCIKLPSFSLEQCFNMYNNYHQIMKKIRQDRSSSPPRLIHLHKNTFVEEEIIYLKVADYLKKISAGPNSKPKIQENYLAVIGRGQNSLYLEAKIAADKKDEKLFLVLSRAYLRFCHKFFQPKEGEETPEQEMADLYKEHFEKKLEK